MRHLAATAAVIALLAIAAGCGGGGSSTSPGSSGGGGTAATANEACAEANQKIASLGTPDNQRAVLEYLEATEETVAKLQAEVAALDAAAGYRDYSQALSKAVSVLNEMSNAARSGNPDAVRELAKRLERLDVGKLAAAAGLDTCAEAPGVES